ncbi:SLC13 family permease [Shinella sp. BYT-45]|uniref:SLC13 family permease n=1 Tax=Shinella sp. BYT-45 TaxID=3377377 RepID=UPI0039812EC1
MAAAATLAAMCISLWSTGAVPEYWPAMAFFAVAIILQVAPAEVVLSGFHSSTLWLLLSGMVMGSAIRHTGLGRRCAAVLAGFLGRRYGTVLAGIVAFSVALAFVMPSSMGRIALLVPIVTSLADHMGYGKGSNGRTAFLMAAAFATCLPAYAILPANTPNMILAGSAESLYGLHISYWDYLVLHFPVLGAAKAAVLTLLILRMFPDHDPAAGPIAPRDGPMTGREWHLLAVLAACLAFWLTDGLHHVSPGWVGLAFALYCLWPGFALTSADCLNKDVNHAPLFFVAGILGLGSVIAATGLGAALVGIIGETVSLSADRPIRSILALTAMSGLVGVATNLPGVPTVMTPGADALAASTGLPLATVLMTQVLAFSNIVLPYQAPPLVTAIQLAALPAKAVTGLCIRLFVITAVVLTPLDLLWWSVLGLV